MTHTQTPEPRLLVNPEVVPDTTGMRVRVEHVCSQCGATEVYMDPQQPGLIIRWQKPDHLCKTCYRAKWLLPPGQHFHPDCNMCQEMQKPGQGFGPSHNGYPGCRSNSLASGGTSIHCTCDSCF